MDLENDLTKTVLNNYIDKDKFLSTGNLSARLILNHGQNDNVYRVLKMELATCKSFTFAVAFVTQEGFTSFLTVLSDLAKRGIHGRVLTSTYLYFNEPEAFRSLMKVPNIETRIFNERDPKTNKKLPFHAKGYLFEHEGYRSAIIGSSNLTSGALISNYEWNLNVNSLDNAEITEQINLQIEAEWRKATPLTEQWLSQYQKHYDQNNLVESEIAENKHSNKIQPNKMQKEALGEIQSLRQSGENTALIISATGTGKTYLGAFDVRTFKPKRFLYVVHREQILQKSKQSFYNVIGGNYSDYGIYSGNHQEGLNSKYVFATVQTLAKDENLKKFAKDAFDYILFDEAHHLGAAQELKIFKYFRPKFCLGMTATPERTDDFNIYKLFNYNIAYEIRLQNALDQDMLCPFHYYGVEDYIYQNELINGASSLNRLVSDERVNYILQQTDYYGYSGRILHGLIFCSRKKEAEILAEKLTKKDCPSLAISGTDSISKREKAVKRLEKGQVKYLITVDVFNEDVDIPCINQIVLLRNTQSSIVFVQQLGRGLRKYKGKDYLTVIDFVGDYDNNYLIPVALTGDKSHNRDRVRDKLDLEPIYGVSLINFTNVAKEQIYKSINHSNLTLKRKLREEYTNEKRKFGRIPLMYDLQKESIDCEIIAEKYKNYSHFLQEMGESAYQVSDFQDKILEFLTVVLANGKREHELLLLNELLSQKEIKEKQYLDNLRKNHCLISDDILKSVDAILSLSYFVRKSLPNKETYGGESIVEHKNKKYSLNKKIREELINQNFYLLFRDAIRTGLLRSKKYDSEKIFTIDERYTRMDANRLLNWEKIVPGQNIGGYKFDYDKKNCAIFITYNKKPDAQTLAYQDQFINQSIINMYSKYPRNLESKEIQNFKDKEITFHLFVKKSDDDGKSFIYLGTCQPQVDSFREKAMKRVDKKNNAKTVKVVSMNLKLTTPVDINTYYMLTKIKY